MRYNLFYMEVRTISTNRVVSSTLQSLGKPWSPLERHFWAHEGEGSDWQQPAWIFQGIIMPDQPD